MDVLLIKGIANQGLEPDVARLGQTNDEKFLISLQ